MKTRWLLGRGGGEQEARRGQVDLGGGGRLGWFE